MPSDAGHIVLELPADQQVVADGKQVDGGGIVQHGDGLLQIVVGDQGQGVLDGFLL